MAIELPPLPYARDALAPHMSRETLDYHYGKHHKKYVEETNKLIAGTPYEKMALEKIVKSASGKLLNNAAQAWNHTFFWNCLRPAPAAPGKRLEAALSRAFGDVEEFKKRFAETAVETFGSGWAWLVKTSDGKLKVISTSNAGNPLTKDSKPLLACDVWEHAYYIDYRNERPKYLEHFWNIVNWEFIETNLFGGSQAHDPRLRSGERRPHA